ncbi:DMT family transporter [Cupriavidus plantarum]|uniref:Drug/metabolite transporter (DMT)-like permease n=1 Tax=Cupriavidus plantarum TaxID=942865 RepID=A0A316ER52_9BURK|nr:DMT family transporter [Cupriavidus plantarum]PWK33976.1 drug/metabolite transporter (DMT)-like permease [Cupriavidus plantarum]
MGKIQPCARTMYLPKFALAALGLIWGTNFLFMKWASVSLSATQIVFLRVLCGFVPVLLFALAKRALRWQQLRHIHHFAVMSLLATVIYYYAFAKGSGLLPSGVAGMLSGAIPLVSALCTWALLRHEQPTSRMLAGIAFGLAGVVLIAQPWRVSVAGVSLTGVAYMLLGCVSVGCSFVYARRYLSGLDMSPLALCTWQIGIALAIISALTDFGVIGRVADDPRTLVGTVLGLGVCGTGIAYVIYYYIVGQLGALTAASVTYIPPVVALMIGAGFAGEPVRPVEIVAACCIVCGVYLLQRRPSAAGERPSRS